MSVRDGDDALELGGAQQQALATFEHASEVFVELGGPRPDDAAKLSAWVGHAVADAAAVTSAAAAASKLWLIGGAIVLAAGVATVASLVRDDRDPPADQDATAIASPEAAADQRSIALPPPAVDVARPASTSLTPIDADIAAVAPALSASKPKPRAHAEPTAATASAAELLRQAAVARRDGDRTRALELYRRIGREFRDSREDKVASVAIGRLELDAGRPERALAAFEAYLRDRSTGNLAQEAAFGRASALRALGRAEAERAALKDFVAKFPDAVQLQRARARLLELGG
jgi:tetratricopeptide (TPR) repeat protein